MSESEICDSINLLTVGNSAVYNRNFLNALQLLSQLLRHIIVYHFFKSIATKPRFSDKIGEGYCFCRAHYFSDHHFQ